MPGHLQEGFGCVVTNRFDQLFDDEDDPFDVLKQAEKKKMDATAPGAAKTAAQVTKQPKKESQKERKIQVSEKEETQAPVPLKKDGKYRLRSTRHLVTLSLSEQSAKDANVTKAHEVTHNTFVDELPDISKTSSSFSKSVFRAIHCFYVTHAVEPVAIIIF